jgi:hypothetical protein
MTRTNSDTPSAPAVQPQPPPERTYLVAWLRRLDLPGRATQFVSRSVPQTAGTPEQAGAEALLRCYGPVRPAGAPDAVTVDGVPYQVDEWVEAAVYLVPQTPAALARARAARGLRHLRLARAALAAIDSAAPADAPLGLLDLSVLDAEDYLVALCAELDRSTGGAR